MPEEQRDIWEHQTSNNQGFTLLGNEEADISMYQSGEKWDAKASQKTMSVEEKLISLHALSKIILGVVIVLCLVLIFDGYAKSSPSGNALTGLPFFQQGNFFCNRTNGGVNMDFVLQDEAFLAQSKFQDIQTEYDSGVCFSRNKLFELYEEYKTYHENQIQMALKEVLPRKFSYVSFSESPLFRFVQSKAPERRVQHDQVIETLLEQVDVVNNQSNVQLICQKILFEEKVANVSCIARARAGQTSRDVVLDYIDAIKRTANLLIINHPESVELRALENEEYTTETVFDLQIVERESDYEVEILDVTL